MRTAIGRAGAGVAAAALWLGGGVPGTAHGQSVVIGEAGSRGYSAVSTNTCAYRVVVARGILRIGVRGPTVSGANPRPRRRNERTYVRFKIYVTDRAAGDATLIESGWSDWLTLREWETAAWGPTYYDMDWRGNYGVDVRIEWWNARRLLGWRAQRVTAFHYFDQYGVGPIGPLAWCAINASQYDPGTLPLEIPIDPDP